MSAVMLTNFKLSGSTGTYVDAMYSVLTHKGWFRAPKHMLAGMTTLGFRFTVHRRLAGESITAYNWKAEHFLAADFIGMTTSQKAGFSFAATFPLYQQYAVDAIKESIDRGIGAIFWRDAFVVACGYDDELGVLYYAGGCVESAGSGSLDDVSVQSLPYDEFGKNVSPYWYYQVFEDQVELDPVAIYKESLMQAIYRWEAHDPLLPEEDYACGHRAYTALEEAFRNGSMDLAEAGRVIRYYACCKREMMLYTRTLRDLWPGMGAVADSYSALATVFNRMAEAACYPAAMERPTITETQAHFIADRIAEAGTIEDRAIQSLRAILRETLDNRFHDISLR
jgi:hypothetical protein